MRIISPSFTLLDELDDCTLAERIEYCGRICYKSEHKIDQNSAVPFVRRMAAHGHNSVLEMGVITLQLDATTPQPGAVASLQAARYLTVDSLTTDRYLITGSIRAFREQIQAATHCPLTQALHGFLYQQHPYFFESTSAPQLSDAATQCEVRKWSLKEITALPPSQQAKHRHLSVKFIVNRAVTHELVRHRPCSFLQESQRYCRYDSDQFCNEITFIKPLFFTETSTEFQLWQQAMQRAEQDYLTLLQTASPQAARTVLPNSCKTELILQASSAQWQHIFRLRTDKTAEPSMREVMIPLQIACQKRFPEIFNR